MTTAPARLTRAQKAADKAAEKAERLAEKASRGGRKDRGWIEDDQAELSPNDQ